MAKRFVMLALIAACGDDPDLHALGPCDEPSWNARYGFTPAQCESPCATRMDTEETCDATVHPTESEPFATAACADVFVTNGVRGCCYLTNDVGGHIVFAECE
ncbi:MAG: hypothetical protein H0T79_15940 [Deltaproteobacteria bacterium]|nr:hypothetical protein [Deltaproteobacteria bacterium]